MEQCQGQAVLSVEVGRRAIRPIRLAQNSINQLFGGGLAGAPSDSDDRDIEELPIRVSEPVKP